MSCIAPLSYLLHLINTCSLCLICFYAACLQSTPVLQVMGVGSSDGDLFDLAIGFLYIRSELRGVCACLNCSCAARFAVLTVFCAAKAACQLPQTCCVLVGHRNICYKRPCSFQQPDFSVAQGNCCPCGAYRFSQPRCFSRPPRYAHTAWRNCCHKFASSSTFPGLHIPGVFYSLNE